MGLIPLSPGLVQSGWQIMVLRQNRDCEAVSIYHPSHPVPPEAEA